MKAKLKLFSGSSHCGSAVMNTTSIHEDGCAMGCGVGCKCSSDPALLWLWCRPAATPQLQLQFDPQPGNLHMPQVQPKTKKKNLFSDIKSQETSSPAQKHDRNVKGITSGRGKMISDGNLDQSKRMNSTRMIKCG